MAFYVCPRSLFCGLFVCLFVSFEFKWDYSSNKYFMNFQDFLKRLCFKKRNSLRNVGIMLNQIGLENIKSVCISNQIKSNQ